MKKQLLSALFLSLAIASLQAKTYATIDGKPAVTDKDLEILKQSIPNFNYSKLSDQEKEGLSKSLLIVSSFSRLPRPKSLILLKNTPKPLTTSKTSFLLTYGQKSK